MSEAAAELQSFLDRLDEIDAMITSLAQDAYRAGDKQTVWYCQKEKEQNGKRRGEITEELSIHRKQDKKRP